MRRVSLLTGLSAGILMSCVTHAAAAPCPGNPQAIGISRVITFDMREFPRVGSMQYPRSLPLAERELVLTFDDGPLPPYTLAVLETLRRECIKAVFFLVGRQANAHPDIVRQIYNAGHTIGTHSQNHPLTFNQMAPDAIEREIGDGIASVDAALGDARALAPFFRIPGFLRAKPVEDYLTQQNVAIWSTDFDADDWKQISVQEVMQRALDNIEKRKRGILLLHDVQPSTAMALPGLLQELRKRGYRFVHVVPPGDRPKTLPTLPSANRPGWPRVSGAGNDVPLPSVQQPAPPPERPRERSRRDRWSEARPDPSLDDMPREDLPREMIVVR